MILTVLHWAEIRNSAVSLAFLSACLAACASVSAAPIDDANEVLGRGINLGNALEAPYEGAWGLSLEAGYFDLIADAGFDSVRVPIRWSAHAADNPPYTVDPAFFERIDWVLAQANRVGLAAVLNVHHYDELMADPQAHRQRFVGLWRQISARYANQPDTVFFELLNEPHGAFNDNPQLWNQIAAQALAEVRQRNPNRAVIIGPVAWNSIDRLPDLQLPLDANLITTVHYYEPFEFTHQGASWVSPVPPVGVSWRAGTQRIAAGFSNWSWDTTVAETNGALQVRLSRQYAAFSLHRDAPLTPTRLRLRVRGSGNFDVLCEADGSASINAGQFSIASTAFELREVDMRACGDNINRVSLMSTSEGETAVEFHNSRLCERRRCHLIVNNSLTDLRLTLQQARNWSRANASPVYVGEFGAYRLGDSLSRRLWTYYVQREIVRAGFSSAYWEFGAGFGLYDPARAVWRQDLLNAVLSP